MSTSAAIASTTEEDKKLPSIAERFCRRFLLSEIQLATEDFSDSHLIGEGGSGKVYKGLIDDGRETVAMKRLAQNSSQGARQFLAEIGTLSKVRHVNLVSLIGYCDENGERIIVYEYIARGTLAEHLYKLSRNTNGDSCSSLTWKQRLNICIGAGQGLAYLHNATSIIHRDVKSTNILLDENLMAKVSDFGLAKQLTIGNSKSHVTTKVRGTPGYWDPRYYDTGKLTKKSDTYAFGVVLLEVLSGKAAGDEKLAEDEMGMVRWAQKKIRKGKVRQILDSNLREEISAECLKTFVGLAKRCLLNEPKQRPTMAQAVVQLVRALDQHERKSANAPRFPQSNAFWNRVKQFGSSKKDEEQVCVEPIELRELIKFTENFSSKYLIGNGHRSLYCGVLKSGHVAAVKKVDYWNLPNHEFLSQVSLISSLKHENMAQLLGYCVDGDQQFLAYEFAQNGSLHDVLHERQAETGRVLSWEQRVKFAFGAAKGLEYIHEKAQIHGNIKSSNVLLSDDLKVAKLVDFGLSSKLPDIHDLRYRDERHTYVFLKLQPYIPPECTLSGEMSLKVDVYSFGIILLELLTGREVVDTEQPISHQHIVNWATQYLRKNNVNRIVDSRMNGEYPRNGVAKMAKIAASCVKQDDESRPDMSTVVRDLRPLLNAYFAMETPNL